MNHSVFANVTVAPNNQGLRFNRRLDVMDRAYLEDLGFQATGRGKSLYYKAESDLAIALTQTFRAV